MKKPKKTEKAIKKIQVKKVKIRDLEARGEDARVMGGNYKYCSPAPT